MVEPILPVLHPDCLWTVLRFHGLAAGEIKLWWCRCACGQEKHVREPYLRNGKSRSCHKCTNKTHGKCYTPEYKAWQHMIERCCKPDNKQYQYYGGRGIRVCERWIVFENFFADMGLRPSPKHSIDRFPDNNGHYEPGNVRWATRSEQMRNTRRTNLLTFNGETLSLKEWADRLCIKYVTLSARINTYGWTVEQALSPALRQGKKPE